MVSGTVTIALKDYHQLIESAEDFKTKKGNLLMSARELEVFLSFISSRVSIDKHIEEFNSQSQTSIISVRDGRAKIQFKNE